jgi:hypothetical protein
MRIVDLTNFRTMPSGTVLQKFHPERGLDGPEILESILGGMDFVSTNLVRDVMSGDDPNEVDAKFTEMHEDGVACPVTFESTARDGEFNADQLFAVWSPDDVAALITVLAGALARQSSVKN